MNTKVQVAVLYGTFVAATLGPVLASIYASKKISESNAYENYAGMPSYITAGLDYVPYTQ